MVPSSKLDGQERGGLPPSISLPVARAGTRSSSVIRNRWMQGEETRQCQTSICTLRRSLRRAWLEVCRWITYPGAKSWPYGAHGNNTPLASNCVKTVRHSVRVIQKLELSVSAVRGQRKMMSVVRAYEVGRFGWGIVSAIKISCPSYLGHNCFLFWEYSGGILEVFWDRSPGVFWGKFLGVFWDIFLG